MKLMAVLLLLLTVTSVSAQVPSRAIKIADGFGDFSQNPIEEITNLYFSGDWVRLQQQTIKMLQNLQFKTVNEAHKNEATLDFERHYYSVVFVYVGPDRKEEVLRFLVHHPSPAPYVLRLPGIKAGEDEKLYEIFLTSNPQNVLISTYTSTQEKSELESQLPKFLKQFDPKVLEDLLEAVPPQNRTHAVLSRVDLPFSHATVQVEDVVQQGDQEITENFKMFNRPLTRFSLGVVSSLIVSSAESDTRATIQSGDLTQDPLRGHMPMGVLNIHPVPYDAESDSMSWRERFRLFVGGILAPEFGVSAGIGLQLIRGFSINGGVGLLLIDTLKPGESIGEEPVDPDDPFEYGTATVLFFGVGYNF
jgi:hypothetical protein